ncbi:CLIP domain-containing serine protease B15 [Drosophila ficusphila]|uniref:CLIP domain-containing serine protease B15 n=1 Tax=Drosophila ficusphila TaxID=30025 RepID=UPI0007E6A47A|nr:CLIP domain-containing serine protease B15 [Drosophila ficusphila]
MNSTAGVAVIAFFLVLCKPGFARLLEPNCGINVDGPSYGTRIIGGSDAHITAHPWMAFLHFNSKVFCGGTLITRQFVLTAAHCIEGVPQFTVRLGGTDLSPSSSGLMCELPAEDYLVEHAIKHKYFTADIGLNDIGILRLGKLVTYNVHIRPICIVLDPAMELLVRDNISLVATGWGKTDSGRVAARLQEAPILVVDRDICTERYKFPLSENQICAGGKETNTCLGDSGGPLGGIVNVYGTLRFVQYGITSYGDRECRAPSTYTDVTRYYEWIELVVDKYSR